MPPEVIAKTYKLMPTELRILLAVVEVGSAAETAAALGIAERTVRFTCDIYGHVLVAQALLGQGDIEGTTTEARGATPQSQYLANGIDGYWL